ncbi:MAG: histidine phosphatase family protein [Burkholderiaceae bacterium]
MNLILWRHAEAEDATPDLTRELTGRGRKQAARMAEWLAPRLPGRYAILCSPAARTIQTVEALERDYVIDRRLSPGADVADYLAAAGWPEGPRDAGGTVVIVGHQPTLGGVASLLLSGSEQPWSIKKGAIWWLSSREREGRGQIVLRASVHPDLL